MNFDEYICIIAMQIKIQTVSIISPPKSPMPPFRQSSFSLGNYYSQKYINFALYKGNNKECAPSCMTSFILHNVLKIHPCYHMHYYFVPFLLLNSICHISSFTLHFLYFTTAFCSFQHILILYLKIDTLFVLFF